MMRCLSRWPFDNELVDKNVIYPGFELDVFENICDHFMKELSIMPLSIALSILNVVNEIARRNRSSSRKLSQ